MSISASVLALFCIILFFKMRPAPADDATSASSEENLVKQSLPSDLPTLVELPERGGADGRELVHLINQHKRVLTSGGVDKDEESAAVVSEMMNCAGGSMAQGLLDANLPDNQVTSTELDKAILAVETAVELVIKQHTRDLEFEQARQIAYAELLFGRAVFENNTRLNVRRSGISLMNHALGQMQAIDREAFELGVIDRDDVEQAGAGTSAWRSAINSVNDAWKVKLASINAVDSANDLPNIADLIRIANEDKDLTFRVFATLRLGYAFHERGGSSNRETILAALDELKASDEQMVADAAEAAIKITTDVEIYRDLR